jgi:acylphosphatase
MSKEGLHVRVEGEVQGVGYRFFAENAARNLQLTGWVRNLPGGAVEAEAEGMRGDLEKWLGALRQGPPGSTVTHLTANWYSYSGKYSAFEIRI